MSETIKLAIAIVAAAALLGAGIAYGLTHQRVVHIEGPDEPRAR